MNRFLRVVCLLLVPLALSGQSSRRGDASVGLGVVTTPDNRIVPGERIGAIRLGMGMDEVQSLLGKPRYSFASPNPAGETWQYPNLNLEILFDHNAAPVVTFIRAKTWPHKSLSGENTYWKDQEPPRISFQTASGVAIGSSSFDVKRAYPGNSYDSISGLYMDYKSLGVGFNITVDHIVWSINVYRPN